MNRKTSLPDDLKGLGRKSIECLNSIGIYTKADLERIGPVNAFIKLKRELKGMKPSLNLLYGMVAVVEGIHWREVAKNDKVRLLMELESHADLNKILDENSD